MSSITPQRFLGIDPGSGTLGYGIVEKIGAQLTIIDYGVIQTRPHAPLSDKLVEMANDLEILLEKYPVQVVGIEKLFFGKNITTGIDVAHARGITVLALARRGMEIREFSPPEIKKGIAGSGKATKMEVRRSLMKLFAIEKPPKPDDAADALAIAFLVASGASRKLR